MRASTRGARTTRRSTLHARRIGAREDASRESGARHRDRVIPSDRRRLLHDARFREPCQRVDEDHLAREAMEVNDVDPRGHREERAREPRGDQRRDAGARRADAVHGDAVDTITKGEIVAA